MAASRERGFPQGGTLKGRALGIGFLALFLLGSAALTVSPAMAQETRDYVPADFARYAPRNALQMLQQVPGFIIREQSWVEFCMSQCCPVMLVIGTFAEQDERPTDEEKLEFADVRWMEITTVLKRESNNGKKPVKQIQFKGERLDMTSVRKQPSATRTGTWKGDDAAGLGYRLAHIRYASAN